VYRIHRRRCHHDHFLGSAQKDSKSSWGSTMTVMRRCLAKRTGSFFLCPAWFEAMGLDLHTPRYRMHTFWCLIEQKNWTSSPQCLLCEWFKPRSKHVIETTFSGSALCCCNIFALDCTYHISKALCGVPLKPCCLPLVPATLVGCCKVTFVLLLMYVCTYSLRACSARPLIWEDLGSAEGTGLLFLFWYARSCFI
jgi:hypothetical protein